MMDKIEAIKQAQEILLDEANELSLLNRDPALKTLSHRALVAIQREVR